MKKQLNKIAKDTNIFLKKYINSQKYSQLNVTHEVWSYFQAEKK